MGLSGESFTKNDAKRVIDGIECPAPLRFENEIFYAARAYERDTQEILERPAEIWSEIDKIYRIVQTRSPTDRRRKRLFSALLMLSDSSLLYFGVPPDERTVAYPGHTASQFNALIRNLCAGENLDETFARVFQVAKGGLSMLPYDRGGTKPRDAAVAGFVERVRRTYQKFTGRRPRYGQNDVTGELVGEFLILMIGIGERVNPPITSRKMYDYVCATPIAAQRQLSKRTLKSS